ncbi:iron chelate uptake ABC transporter family permease subunit [Actinomadura sp. PM05-2]|uniref:Iron chelate uptake ABC transporter family permease subunit n=2 Tax=Actinomadura parmotrematis TaxID=2864039 RepID=A0ABS7FSR3_9ACTN|nr:iron chelate uptake ABC transporter family permease subunit [Actinomadura parmotrematis]
MVVTALLAAAAAALAVVAIGGGEFSIGPADVVRVLLGGGDPADAFIVRELRLPRAAAALAVGAGLGLSGAIFQSVSRNPLGSPDFIGIGQGASAGVLTSIVLFGAGTATAATGAVAGGLLAGAAILAITGRRGTHGQRLVLVGVGVAAMLTGVNSYLLTRARIEDAARAVLWLTGSLDGRDWADTGPLLIGLAVLVPAVLLCCARPMRMLEMGDDAAHGLGVPVGAVRAGLLAAAIVLAALASAAAGPVAFVALIAPQLARKLTRTPGPNLLPSLCTGAVLLAAADLAGQRAFPGHQLPAGVVTGLLGGGYLVWLLVTERRTGRI